MLWPVDCILRATRLRGYEMTDLPTCEDQLELASSKLDVALARTRRRDAFNGQRAMTFS
jgi:hypothetical protein